MRYYSTPLKKKERPRIRKATPLSGVQFLSNVTRSLCFVLFSFQLRPSAVPYTWKLLTQRSLDYESAQSHHIAVQVKDTKNSMTVNQTFTIYVTNVNEAPSSIALSNGVIPENSPRGTVVGNIGVTDPDEPYLHQNITCELRNDAGGTFSISGQSLTVSDSRMLNYEAPGGPDYLIDVECQDQDGEATQQQFTVKLTDVNEPPIRIESSTGKFEVREMILLRRNCEG